MDNKTQTITFDKKSDIIYTPKTISNSQTNEVNKPKTRDHRRVAFINKYYQYFPQFYIKEIKRAFWLFITWIFLSMIILGGLATLTWYITYSTPDWWLSLFLIPIAILVIALLVVYTDKYFNIREEAKTINFKDEKVLSNNIRKLYLRLKTGYINVNWMAGLTYVVCGLIILFCFVIVYCINVWTRGGEFAVFGRLIIENDPNNMLPMIFVCTCGGILIIAFAMHVWLLVSNYTRYSKMESYYNCPIVTSEELTTVKKSKNRRDLFIFLAVVGLLILIGYFIYKMIKKRTNKGQVVINN